MHPLSVISDIQLYLLVYQLSMQDQRKRLYELILPVIAEVPIKVAEIDILLQSSTNNGKTGLDRMLDFIQKGHTIKITFNINQIKTRFDEFIKSEFPPKSLQNQKPYFQTPDFKYLCHDKLLWILALLDKNYHHLLKIRTQDVNQGITLALASLDKIKDPNPNNNVNNTLTFPNLLIQTFRVCLSRHNIVINLQNLWKIKETELEIKYESNIKPEFIKNAFEGVKNIDLGNTNPLDPYLKTYREKRYNQRDFLYQWISDKGEDLKKQFQKKMKDTECYGFSNSFTSVSKLAMMINYIHHEIKEQKKPTQETLDVTKRCTSVFTAKMNDAERSKLQIQAFFNGKNVRYLKQFKIRSNVKQLTQQAEKNPDLFSYTELNGFQANSFITYDEDYNFNKQDNTFRLITAKAEDVEEFRNHRQMKETFKYCSESFVKLILIKYLGEIQKAKAQGNKKAKKSADGFRSWIMTGKIEQIPGTEN